MHTYNLFPGHRLIKRKPNLGGGEFDQGQQVFGVFSLRVTTPWKPSNSPECS
jgi:hypothetical protein